MVAENGLCKTTILQAIAALSLGPARASALANVLSYPDLRAPEGREKNGAQEDQDKLGLEAWMQGVFCFGPIGDRVGPRDYPFYPKDLSPDQRWLASILGLKRRWSSFEGHSGYTAPEPVPVSEQLLSRMSPEEGKAYIRRWTPRFDDPSADPVRPMGDLLDRVRRDSLPHWFVAGYGVSRYVIAERTALEPKEPAVDRVRTLFGEGRLAGLDFYDLLKNRDPALADAFVDRVDEALVQRGKLLPRVEAFDRRGANEPNTRLANAHRFTWRAGESRLRIPATWLSHGYQGTISWIADLIGQVLWEAETDVPLDEMEGLVLIDELDLHLHPRWQRELVPALREMFPAFQFIVTTHSPALLPAFAPEEVVLLRQNEQGDVVSEPTEVDPRVLTGSQIYQEFFGLKSLHPAALDEKLRLYGWLASDPGRSEAQDAELRALRETLRAAGQDPGWDPVPLDPTLRDPA